MENNPINRIKLLMSYDSKMTLNENLKELNLINENDIEFYEQNKFAKVAKKLSGVAAKDGTKVAKKLAGTAAKDVSKVARTGAKDVSKVGDEYATAFKKGEKMGLNADEIKQVMGGEKVVQRNMDDALKKEFKFNNAANQVVGPETEKAAKQLSLSRALEATKAKGKPLTKAELDQIVNQTKNETLRKVEGLRTNVKAGKIPNPNVNYQKKAETLQNQLKDSRKQNQVLEKQLNPETPLTSLDKKNGIVIQGNNGPVKVEVYNNAGDVNKSYAKRGKRKTVIDPVTGKPVTVVEPKPKPTPPITEPGRVSRLLKSKWLWSLGILGGTVWAFWYLFHKTGTKPPVVSDCLTDLVNKKLATIEATNAGDPVFVVKNLPGYSEYDSVGGLWFYQTTGIVVTADNGATKKGTWTCTNGKLEIMWEGDGGGTTDDTTTDDTTTDDTTTDDTTNVTGDTTGDTTNVTGTTTGDTTTNTTDNATADDAQNSRIADMIKTKENDDKPQEMTPEVEDLIEKGKEIYTTLYDNYNAEGQPKPFIKSAGKRLKYKGQLLSQDDLDALNQYIKSLGYEFLKQKDKRYVPGEKDEKYVWIKKEESVEQQPETQPEEPENLNEDFIKKIVAKHLRSKL